MLDRKKHVEELIDGAQFLKRRASILSSEDAGITTSQWLVIGHIFRSDGCTVNETAKALGMSGSAITQLVNGLVAKKYVKRLEDPADRRAHRLVLSTDSKKRITTFKKKRLLLMLKMFDVLSDPEFEQYLALNKKVMSGLSKKDL